MTALSNYAEQKLLDHISRIASYTAPSGLTLALSTANPDEDGSGIAEPSGDGYARETIAFETDGQQSGKYQVKNTAVIAFTANGGSWGTITHVAIFDTEGTPNMLAYGALDASKLIGDGDSLEFAAAAIKWNIT